MNWLIKILKRIGFGKLAGIIGRLIWNRVIKRAIKRMLKENAKDSLDWLEDWVYKAGWAVSEFGNELAKDLDMPEAYEGVIEPEFRSIPKAFDKGMSDQSGTN